MRPGKDNKREEVMKERARFGMTLVVLVVSLAISGCGGGGAASPPPPPLPTISTISPSSKVAGDAAFTLTINGTNFIAASMVNFGGTAPTTTFVSATQLTAAIPAAAIASAGTAVVTVTNPAPGGATSNTVNFTITSGTNPVPTINSLDPSCAPVGGQALTLFVFGSNFVASSVVRWNGSDRPTTFGDSSGLTAQISTSDIAVAGTAAVTVFNPAPGGGSSNSLTFTTTAGGVGPQSIAVDPTGKFAYVANTGCPSAFDGNVSMYTVDATTGALASIGPPVDSLDEGGHSVTVDPSGKFAYVANWGEGDTAGSVSMYTINVTTGALTSTGMINGVCPGLCAPWSVVVHPSGKFAYVANEGGPSPTGVSMFTINTTTGALTSIGTIAAAGRAISVAVDPSGKFAYVTDGSNGFPAENNKVSMYTIDTTTGALKSTGTIDAGINPSSVAVDPLGKFAYVANSGSNDVSMYTINTPTGALTSIGPIAAGSSPSSIAVDPSGKFAYLTNSGSNDVSMYSIDATGALTLIGRIVAGLSPSSIAIHPSGKFAYVTNSGSNNVSMYSIDVTTGALTLIGTIGT
jgi:6-phosphogluconolactonase (cycloisomerase 2 family)